MADLIERLRAISRHEHDDLSIGDEAADEIERLQRQLDAGTEAGWHALRNERDALRADRDAQQETIGALKRKLVLAEADRDALRSRIEGALVVHDVTGKYGFVGKHVALVVLND